MRHSQDPMMGYQLVRDAIAKRPTWRISDRAYAVLLRMAFSALDPEHASEDHPARHYFGGWWPLAMTLGYLPDRDEWDAEVLRDQPLSPAAERAISRALRELTAAQLIKRTDAGGRGRRANYELTY